MQAGGKEVVCSLWIEEMEMGCRGTVNNASNASGESETKQCGKKFSNYPGLILRIFESRVGLRHPPPPARPAAAGPQNEEQHHDEIF